MLPQHAAGSLEEAQFCPFHIGLEHIHLHWAVLAHQVIEGTKLHLLLVQNCDALADDAAQRVLSRVLEIGH